MGVELGILFAFGAMICWGFGDFLIQRNVRKEGNLESLFFIGIIGMVGLLPFVWKDLPALIYLPNLARVIVLGVLTFFAAVFEFEALKKGKISVVEIVFQIELLFVILLGILVFKERLTGLQWGAVLLVFVGIMLISVRSYSFQNLKKIFEKGILLAILGSIFMGSVDFLTASSARTISPIMAVWGPALVYSILCILFILKRKGIKKMRNNIFRYKYLILLMGIFDTLAWTFYAFATSSQPVGITTAITQGYPAICLLLGLFINKEKIMKHQFVGAGLALVASFFLGFVL